MARGMIAMAVAGAALLTGGCEPDTGGGGLAPELRPIAQGIVQGADTVAPRELADWLVAERQDFALVDVRAPEAFDQAHIEDARNIPVTALVESDTLEQLPRDRKVVLYSEDTRAAAQAAVLLRLQGLDAHLLEGGYAAWRSRVLEPDLEAAGEDTAAREKLRAIACHFRNEAYEPVPPTPEEAPAATAEAAPEPQKPQKPAGFGGFRPRLAPAAPGGSSGTAGGLIVDEGC